MGKGHLGLLQDLTIFTIQNDGPYVPQSDPPPSYLNIPSGAAAHECKRLRSKIKTTNTAIRSTIMSSELASTKSLKSLNYYTKTNSKIFMKVLNSIVIRIFIVHIMDCYCKIGQDDINKNTNTFNQGINPSLSLAVYFWRQEVCQDFIADASVSISDKTIVTISTKYFLQIGGLQQYWHELWHHPVYNQTWNNWKNHCTYELIEKRDIQKLTGGINIGQAKNVTEMKMEKQMIFYHENISNAAVQRNHTVKNWSFTKIISPNI